MAFSEHVFIYVLVSVVKVGCVIKVVYGHRYVDSGVEIATANCSGVGAATLR